MFRALSESSRLRILTLLAGRQMSAGALAERMRIPEAAVVDHMKPLLECGLITSSKDEEQLRYRIEEERIGGVCRYLNALLQKTEQSTVQC